MRESLTESLLKQQHSIVGVGSFNDSCWVGCVAMKMGTFIGITIDISPSALLHVNI